MKILKVTPREYCLYAILYLSVIFSACNTETKKKLDIPESVQRKSDSLSTIILADYMNKNPFKEKAAEYLMENLKYHYFYKGEKEDIYLETVNKYYTNKDTLKAKLKLLKDQRFPNPEMEFDISYLSAEDIKNNIELAYSIYNKTSWKDKVSLDLFCNYILPPRIEKRGPDNWREYYLNYFMRYDSSFFKKDMKSVIREVYAWQRNWDMNFDCLWGDNNPKIPGGFPTASIDKLTYGSCAEKAVKQVGIMRSLGIPATIDYSPMWLNCNSDRHDWGLIFLDSVNFEAINFSEPGVYKRSDFMVSKVFRKSYSPNFESHVFYRGYCKFLPEYFNDPFINDVTSSYIKTIDVEIEIDKDIPEEAKIAYLAAYRHPDWIPIDWSEIKGDKTVFHNINQDGMYLLVYIDENGMKYLQDPVSVKNADVHYYHADTTKLRSVKLTRKYYLGDYKFAYMGRMIGGKFQGANKADFSDAVNLYEVKKHPGPFFNEIAFNNSESFRYLRYLSPDSSYGNVAEIEFYENPSDTAKMTGRIIGTKGSMNNDPVTTSKAAFDGNLLSIVNAPEPNGSWTGLDLGRKKRLSKLRFLTRTDMNFIYAGNVYELKYWSGEWKSLGVVTADTSYIIYNNVPSNALLLLRNLTTGQEERIFTYENGEQVWW